MPFGPPRVGKTCLLHRLLGKPPPGIRATCDGPGSGSCSTGVMDERRMIQVPIPKSIITESGKWKEIENLEEETAVYFKTIENLSSYSGLQPFSLPLTKNDPPKPKPDNYPVGALGSGPVPISTHTLDTVSVQLDDVIESIERKDMSKVEVLLDNTLTIFYTDTGGQPEFQEVVPALVAGPTIFIFIFNLFRGLNSKYTVTYGSSDGEHNLYESSFTVKEVFMQFLSSIASYHNLLSHDVALHGSKSIVPPLSVLVVGTHKDLVSKSKINEIDMELKELLEESSLYECGFIEYLSAEQLIIPVDNYDDKNDSSSVRKVVERIIGREKDGINPYKIEFPVHWLALGLSLRKMKTSTVTHTKCIEIAKKCNVSEEDLPNCLWFLHHKTGTIRYYDSVKELKGIVIIQPSVMFSAISEFITSTFTLDNVDVSRVNKFKRLGLFDSTTVKGIFTKYEDKFGIPYNAFLALLDHLKILGNAHNLESDHYFLPCALVHAEEPPPSMNQDPLLLVFDGGFVPKGVFSALLVFLCEKEWRIQYCKGLPLLYRHQASFYTDSNCAVTLKDTSKCCEVRVEVEGKQAGGKNKFQCDIRHVLQEGILNIYETLRYDQSFYNQRFGFYCNLPKCADDIRHIAMVEYKREKFEIRCSRTRITYSLNSEREDWFITSNQG